MPNEDMEVDAVISDNCLGDADQSIDYESPVLSVGMSWADVTDQVGDAGSDATSDADYADSVDNMSWSMVIKRTPAQKVNTPQDFVIPHDGNVGDSQQRSSQFSVRGQGGMAYTWSLDSRGLQPNLVGLGLQHKSTLDPIYLAYSRVGPNATGLRISLMQIATAVVQSLGDATSVDAVQPMKTGWWIYLNT